MSNKQYPIHDSSFKIKANYIAMIAYLIPLAYLLLSSIITIPSIISYIMVFSPFIIYFFERKSEFVRFHAVTSIILNVILPIIFELLVIIITLLGLHHIQMIGIVLSFIYLLLVLGIVALSIYNLIKANFFYITGVPIISKMAYYFAKESNSN